MSAVNELIESVLAFAGAAAMLSLPLKISWGVFAAWIAGQLFWFLRIRVVPAAPPTAPPRKVRRPRSAKRNVPPKAAVESSAPLMQVELPVDAMSAAADTVYR